MKASFTERLKGAFLLLNMNIESGALMLVLLRIIANHLRGRMPEAISESKL